MLLRVLTTVVAFSTTTFYASASPLDRRQDASTRSVPTAALIVTTNSDGQPTTVVQLAPTQLLDEPTAALTAASTAAEDATPASTTSERPARTDDPIPSSDFPQCTDPDAKPFCDPSNDQTLYIGETYYVTWNPEFFKKNTTVTITLNYDNSTNTQADSSPELDVSRGVTTFQMKGDWMQGKSFSHLKFYALNFDASNVDEGTKAYDGPKITLTNKPVQHLPADSNNKLNKQGLYIGLPVGLGVVALVCLGLYFGMRKQRKIGLGNIMGKRHGYGSRKSRRERLGLNKKGAIRLEERELNQPRERQYQDDFIPAPLSGPNHRRDESLGSLVSDDDRPRGNAFRDEVERQRTGR